MSNLIEDIGRARENLRKREAEASEAGYTLKMCRAEALKARMALDELLDELVSGRSKYPIFERIERHGSNGTHDEPTPQAGFPPRGPTDFAAANPGPESQPASGAGSPGPRP